MEGRCLAGFFALAAFLVLLPPPAAGFTSDSPLRACNYLVGSDVQTEGYQHYHGDTYGCEGSYTGSNQSLRNGNYLTYQVLGSADRVRRLELSLSVMSSGNRHRALSSFADLAGKLFSRALGRPLPGEVSDFIQNGQQGVWELEGATLELTRQEWSSGKGFDLILSIE
jgi:hypothetical protein